jgi:hypothetical protein
MTDELLTILSRLERRMIAIEDRLIHLQTIAVRLIAGLLASYVVILAFALL